MSIVREITVVDQSTSSRKTIKDVSPTNFAELKGVLRDNGFNPEGKSVIEAVSGVSFVADDAQLPTNIMWKGNHTNNLVIMITPLKKTASGALSLVRRALYDVINEHNLGATIKSTTGKHYTNLPTSVLERYVNELSSPQVSNEPVVGEEVVVSHMNDISNNLLERGSALEDKVFADYTNSETYTEEDIEELAKKFGY